MNDRRRVVFRGDDFNKHAINKVPASDQSMETMAAVLHTRLQDLTDAEKKLLSEFADVWKNCDSNPVIGMLRVLQPGKRMDMILWIANSLLMQIV